MRAASRKDPAPVPPPQKDRLQPQPRAGDHPPRREQLLGPVRAAGHQRGHRLRARPHQHDQAPTQMLGQLGPRRHRHPVHRAGVRGRHDPAQPRPAARILRQRHPPPRLDHMRTPAHRRPAPRRRLFRFCGGSHRQVDPEDRADPGGRRGPREAHAAGHRVAVGQRQRADTALGGTAYQVVGERGAVAGRVAGGDMQMREAVHRTPPATRHTPCPAVRSQ